MSTLSAPEEDPQFPERASEAVEPRERVTIAQLSKPRRALVYLAVLTAVTVGGILALGASVVVLGELSGAFTLSML
jgi:hypothetical protein